MATAVYNDPLADQDMVDNAVKVLDTAIDGLVLNSGTVEDPEEQEPGVSNPDDTNQSGTDSESSGNGDNTQTGDENSVVFIALFGALLLSLGAVLLLKKRNREI